MNSTSNDLNFDLEIWSNAKNINQKDVKIKPRIMFAFLEEQDMKS